MGMLLASEFNCTRRSWGGGSCLRSSCHWRTLKKTQEDRLKLIPSCLLPASVPSDAGYGDRVQGALGILASSYSTDKLWLLGYGDAEAALT